MSTSTALLRPGMLSALKARYRARLRKGGWVRAWCEDLID